MKKPQVYLETSFISYMVGKDTTNAKIAADQAWTRKWWEEIAPSCDIFVSDFVLEEAKDGEGDFVTKRLEFLKDIPLLKYDNDEVRGLAEKLLFDDAFPQTAVGYNCPQILKPSTYFEYMEME